MSEERFYVGSTEGYTITPNGNSRWYEIEYLVFDSAYCCEPVGIFTAAGRANSARMVIRSAQARALANRLCRALNARERDRPFDYWTLGVRSAHIPDRGRPPREDY